MRKNVNTVLHCTLCVVGGTAVYVLFSKKKAQSRFRSPLRPPLRQPWFLYCPSSPHGGSSLPFNWFWSVFHVPLIYLFPVFSHWVELSVLLTPSSTRTALALRSLLLPVLPVPLRLPGNLLQVAPPKRKSSSPLAPFLVTWADFRGKSKESIWWGQRVFSKLAVEASFVYILVPLNCTPQSLCVSSGKGRGNRLQYLLRSTRPWGHMSQWKASGSLKIWSLGAVWDGEIWCVTTQRRGKSVVPEAAKCCKNAACHPTLLLAKDISELSSRNLIRVSVSPHCRAEI